LFYTLLHISITYILFTSNILLRARFTVPFSTYFSLNAENETRPKTVNPDRFVFFKFKIPFFVFLADFKGNELVFLFFQVVPNFSKWFLIFPEMN
jgi:hypothetical protein